MHIGIMTIGVPHTAAQIASDLSQLIGCHYQMHITPELWGERSESSAQRIVSSHQFGGFMKVLVEFDVKEREGLTAYGLVWPLIKIAPRSFDGGPSWRVVDTALIDPVSKPARYDEVFIEGIGSLE